MSDELEPNDDIEADEAEQEGEYRPTRGTLAHEDDAEEDAHETLEADESE